MKNADEDGYGRSRAGARLLCLRAESQGRGRFGPDLAKAAGTFLQMLALKRKIIYNKVIKKVDEVGAGLYI